MATVERLSAPYANHLLPVLAAGAGVCRVCGTSVRAHSVCWQCSLHRSLPARADAVGAVALAVKRTQLAYELGAYKSAPQPAVRAALQTRLAAVTWRWLAGHERCLAAAAGVRTTFDVVAVVPSSRTRAEHPLREMVARQIAATAQRHEDLLVLAEAPADAARHSFGADMYLAKKAVGPRSVLLIDDTWTTGGHAQSAACALKHAGAGAVAVLALGRHFQPDQPGEHGAAAKEYLARARQVGWSWERCSRCAVGSSDGTWQG